MPSGKSYEISKNLLDLQYQRYLSYFTTTIIILFTYFIGVAIAIFTRQIDLTNPLSLGILGAISLFSLGIGVFLILSFLSRLSNTAEEIKNL